MKKFNPLLTALLLGTTLVMGCATRPSSIPAGYIPHQRYAGLDCNGLRLERAHTTRQLASFESQQNMKANIDALTVFFFLVPASAFSGDHTAHIARLKGEMDAIETAEAQLGCYRRR